MNIQPVRRAAMERHMERVQEAIEGGHVVRPQEMYDPGLVHPYGDQPPSGKAVLRDLETVYAALKRQPGKETCPEIAGGLKADAARQGRQGLLEAAAAAVLAAGSVAAAVFAPGLASFVGAGAGIAAAGGLGYAAARSFGEARSDEHAAALVEGWQRNIQDPHGLLPIPAGDAVPFEYVRYVEGIMIGQRRRAAFP